jgi:hypothetical protein
MFDNLSKLIEQKLKNYLKNKIKGFLAYLFNFENHNVFLNYRDIGELLLFFDLYEFNLLLLKNETGLVFNILKDIKIYKQKYEVSWEEMNQIIALSDIFNIQEYSEVVCAKKHSDIINYIMKQTESLTKEEIDVLFYLIKSFADLCQENNF